MLISICFFLGVFTQYEKLSSVPDVIKASLEKRDYIALGNRMKKEKIEWQLIPTDSKRYKINKSNHTLSFHDVPVIECFTDSSLLIIAGPLSIESGLRFFLLPSFSEFWHLSTTDLSVIHKFRIPGFVERAKIYEDYIYFKYRNKTYGRKKIR